MTTVSGTDVYSETVNTRDRITSGIGLALIVAGGAAILSGAYPLPEAEVMLSRVWPVLVFVVAMTVVADLSSRCGLFDIVARLVMQMAGAGPWKLWGLLSLLTVTFTVFLSLDTTVVLVTPLAIVLARRARINPWPLALTVVWLANTGSMLLPISNLTNLLAADVISMGQPLTFAGYTWPSALVCISVPMIILAMILKSSLSPEKESARSPGATSHGLGHSPSTSRGSGASLEITDVFISRGRALSYAFQAARNKPEVVVCAVVVTSMIIALLSGIEVWVPSSIAALILAAYVWRVKPWFISARMIPIPMILLTLGLFLALGAAGTIFATELLQRVASTTDSLGDLLGLSGLATLAANSINNLPAYLALEPVGHSTASTIALLIGVNAGPLLTPWASLATLLWAERLVAAQVEFSWRRYCLLGLIAVPITVIAATCTLWATQL